jgi:cell wall-associated NlpC family hydrolase
MSKPGRSPAGRCRGDARVGSGVTGAAAATPSVAVKVAAVPAFAAALIGVLLLAAVNGLGSIASAIQPSAASLSEIPPEYLALFRSAAATCPGLSWTIPAAIGKVESNFGRSTLPGVHDGMNAAGAAGPMQMGIGGAAGPTFYAYDHPVPADMAPTPSGGETPPSPYNPTDAIYAAVRMLCTNGGGKPDSLRSAIYAYNHSDAYVNRVLAIAASYEGLTLDGSSRAALAVRYALDQLGVPYKWGGEDETGFDCSGLTQAAYAAAGLKLPRVAQAQFDAGPKLPADTELQPGDLVFFGSSASAIDHEGMYVGDGQMVDAPHTGAVVRVEPYKRANFVGATRPTLRS